MIRKATCEDLDQIMPLFDKARLFMRSRGNMNQWINGYPSESVIRTDIEKGNFYVEEYNGRLTGCFSFIIGDDPTYSFIEGEWIDSKKYGTVHRLASDGTHPGFSDRCFDFCFSLIDNVRADTHADNIKMQESLIRNGFIYCGIIYLEDGSPRKAYQQLRR